MAILGQFAYGARGFARRSQASRKTKSKGACRQAKLLLLQSCILSEPRSSFPKLSSKGSCPWSVAKMPRQLGATLGLGSYTSFARAFWGCIG